MSASTAPVLQVRDLVVEYEVHRSSSERVQAVRGVSFDVHAGEVVALVGESGSGKSTTAHAVVGLLPGGGRVVGGSVRLHDGELVGLGAKAWQQVRGARIGLVPQDPGIALNPVTRIGDQVAEVLRIHGRVRRAAAAQQAVEILRSVGLSDPEARARQYPHELSGGMRQRVLIGIALALEPALVIADEPTSALDVTVQRRVLDLLDDVTSRTGSAVLFITHDLAVAADRADRVVVMKDGEIVEQGLTAQVLGSPSHPYTKTLLAAAPQLTVRERVAPAPVPAGETPLLDVLSVSKTFRLPGHAGRTVQAVDDVSFSITRGAAFGLVGESGSGKSTVARLVLQLTAPDTGSVLLDGAPVADAAGRAVLRRRSQLVHQNPFASLDPRFTVAKIIDEPLRSHRVGNRARRRERVVELLDQVALGASYADRRPGELSGGQRQRVAIARALALEPDLLVLDEPTSALDVSVQAQILALLDRLRRERGLTYLFISHDLAVVRQVVDRVGVMHDGRLVEVGPTEDVFDDPQDPYTAELVGAIPGRRADLADLADLTPDALLERSTR
ncbi:dipeptide ABC transporter ATP-binding protein [Cellulomonas sp. Leaf395]|uniref:dipeptide ABC transporter ATP-binding protein n=1 Tax=Cellulomonas sp. Leaf395 TaxID=1736362 RepID=UPI0006FA9ED1|nr:ABC transporter ATP-binding protein [Cellulomonas sp. Leaf395]KQS97509.1 ABC transporter ATP-binding protein [Cellulomonas sp. Leaf395]